MFEKKITVPCSGWSLSELFHEIQDVSGDAAAAWRASGEDLKNFGLMWVVVRYEINIVREICPGEELCFTTWALPFRHMMSQRNYLLTDANGDLVLTGAGTWAIVDRTSRRMIEPSSCPVRFGTETSDFSIPRPGAPGKVPFTDASAYQVQTADLDMNLHMNNTRYFDLVEHHRADCFEAGKRRQIRAAFLSEARLGETIELYWGIQDQLQYFSGSKNGTPCFEISILYNADSSETL